MWRENGLIATGVLGVALIGQVWMEATHRADSIGLWYTIYSAFMYAVPLFVLVKVAIVCARRYRATSTRNARKRAS